MFHSGPDNKPPPAPKPTGKEDDSPTRGRGMERVELLMELLFATKKSPRLQLQDGHFR